MKPGDYTRKIKIRLDPQTGDVWFHDPNHPLAQKNGRVSLARHVLSQKLGRWLESGEGVAFNDGSRRNLDPQNLSLSPASEQASPVRSRQVELTCPYCGCTFRVAHSHRERRVHCKEECRRMNSRRFNVDREELEQLVWQMPTTQVARIYGVSDKAIEKRCRLLGIPKPGRGYWSGNAGKQARPEPAGQGREQ